MSSLLGLQQNSSPHYISKVLYQLLLHCLSTRSQTALLCSHMDVLTLNYTTQFSKARTSFPLSTARHSTADVIRPFYGKRVRNFSWKALLSSHLAKTPTETPQEAHPACNFISNMVLLLWILHLDVSQVHGRYQAPDVLPHTHQQPIWFYGQHCALGSPKKRCHDTSRMVFPAPLTTKHVISLFRSPVSWDNCSCYSRSHKVKHTSHTDLDEVRFFMGTFTLFCMSMFFLSALQIYSSKQGTLSPKKWTLHIKGSCSTGANGWTGEASGTGFLPISKVVQLSWN